MDEKTALETTKVMAIVQIKMKYPSLGSTNFISILAEACVTAGWEARKLFDNGELEEIN